MGGDVVGGDQQRDAFGEDEYRTLILNTPPPNKEVNPSIIQRKVSRRWVRYRYIIIMTMNMYIYLWGESRGRNGGMGVCGGMWEVDGV